jgi:hypothetical protein
MDVAIFGGIGMDGHQMRFLRVANFLLFVLGAAVNCEKPCWGADEPRLRAGAASIPITPFGKNPDWDGPVTASGVWGENFSDTNKNQRWDSGEPFTDDPANTALSPLSKEKYDGIYLAGFGNNRMATGKHDDLWACVLVLDYGKTRLAIVALDLIGYYSHGGYYGADQVRKNLDPSLGVTDILIASTHNHEGPDTVGIWGANPGSDGKYPRYLQFVDREIAKAIVQAVKSLKPVRLKLGSTNPQMSPALAGMQGRTWGRPPGFFDEEMRVMQFAGTEVADKGKVVATLINWNTHPESMEDQNTILTSDFPGATRERVEAKYGGTAIYVSGDIGAVEVIGDNESRGRTTFDGQNFPFVPKHEAATYTFARTEAIGHDVAKGVFEALEHGEWSNPTNLAVKKAELRVPMDNEGYKLLMDRGILAMIPMKGNVPEVVTTVYAIELGDAQVITAPGELFPEVFYGVAKYRRTDCAAEDTKRPAEPAVREFMKAKYKFIFGLTPDELGYIVPGYDFHAPAFAPQKGFTEATDACAASGVPTHYHETNSASSQMAPAYACAAVKLLTGNPLAQSPCKELETEAPAH